MNDPTLEAARARIRDGTSELLDELDIPQDAPGIDDLTLDESGILELTIDPSAFDDERIARLIEQIRGLGLSVDGVEHLRVQTTRPDPDTTIRPDGVDHLIAVGGAKGGVGRSTLTVALAVTLSDRGLDVGIFDCDVGSGDIVRLLGVEDPIQSTPDGRPAPVVIDGIQVVSVDLVAGDRPVVWRGAMVHDVLVDLLGGARWEDRDIILLDLPPGVGDAVYTTIQDVTLDGGLVVTTPTELAISGSERTRSLFEANEVPIVTEVTNMIGESGPYATETADTPHTVPFDRGLQTFDGTWPDGLKAATTEALKDLAEAIESQLEPDTEDPLADAVDLRGLPADVVDTQAVLEVADAPDGPHPLLVDDTATVSRTLEDTFEAEPAVMIEHLEDMPVIRPTPRASNQPPS